MAEYGRLFYLKKTGDEARQVLEADYRTVVIGREDAFSPIEVVDLGPIDQVSSIHCWGWYATGPEPKEW